MQHCSLIGWNFVLSWKRVGWRIHGVSILQLPLSPRPLHPLPAPLSLNVWSAGVVHQRELQQCTEHESLQIMQIFEDCSQIPEHRDERSSGNHVNLKIFSSTSSAAILQTSMQAKIWCTVQFEFRFIIGSISIHRGKNRINLQLNMIYDFQCIKAAKIMIFGSV